MGSMVCTWWSTLWAEISAYSREYFSSTEGCAFPWLTDWYAMGHIQENLMAIKICWMSRLWAGITSASSCTMKTLLFLSLFSFFRSMSDWEFVAVGVNSCSFLYWLSKPAETWHITQGIDSKSSISWGNNTDIKPEIKFLPLSFFKLELTAGFLVYV